MKNIVLSFFIFLSFVLSSSKIFGQGTCTAIANGVWDEASTWDCDAPATYPDLTISTIEIGSSYTVTIEGLEGGFNWYYIFNILYSPADTLDAIINLDGNLEFDGPTDIFADPPFSPLLFLTHNSKIILSSTGEIITTQGGGIIIGPFNLVWSTFNGNISGPGVLDENSENGSLPIQLLAFDAKVAGEVVNISWATVSETDNDFFTLERSEDGVNWSMLAEVTGAGTTTVQKNYEFTDYNPMPGLSYYRLKQTDYDGQFDHFPASVVLYEPDNLFKAFPNPTTDILNITTSSDLSNASISVKNLNGQTLQVGESTSSHQTAIDVSNLPIGVYLLEIVFPESVISKRIVKN